MTIDQRRPGCALSRGVMGLSMLAALTAAGCAFDAEELEASDELIAAGDEGVLDGEELDRELDPATAAECEGGANGFVDISDSRRGTAVYTRNLGAGTRVILYYGNVGGVQRGWAMIDGSTIPGDLVWMDWTKDGRASWIQCGPFAVDDYGLTKTSAAQRTKNDDDWQFRACGRAVGFNSVCGPWW